MERGVEGWVGGWQDVCAGQEAGGNGGRGGGRGGRGGRGGAADLELEVVDDGLQRGHEVVVADDGQSEEGDEDDEKLRTEGVGWSAQVEPGGGRTAARGPGGM